MEIRPIVIAGAVDTELDVLIKKLDKKKRFEENEYIFYEGYIDEYPIVVLKTGVATINAAISVTKIINKYNPLAIINEGTAGSHILDLKRGDIIIGEEMVAINSYITPNKNLSKGSNPFEWNMQDFQEGEDGDCTIYKADAELVKIAKKIKETYSFGNVYCARIGSGDVFNREIDRIDWINKNLKTSCEEMEGIAVYTVAKKFNVPVIGLRVISNNELKDEHYDIKYGRQRSRIHI